jgi:hypothetical protein
MTYKTKTHADHVSFSPSSPGASEEGLADGALCGKYNNTDNWTKLLITYDNLVQGCRPFAAGAARKLGFQQRPQVVQAVC